MCSNCVVVDWPSLLPVLVCVVSSAVEEFDSLLAVEEISDEVMEGSTGV